jgi:hypothetical protein
LEANAPNYEELFQTSEEHTSNMEELSTTPEVYLSIHQKFRNPKVQTQNGWKCSTEHFVWLQNANEERFQTSEVLHALAKRSSQLLKNTSNG